MMKGTGVKIHSVIINTKGIGVELDL